MSGTILPRSSGRRTSVLLIAICLAQTLVWKEATAQPTGEGQDSATSPSTSTVSATVRRPDHLKMAMDLYPNIRNYVQVNFQCGSEKLPSAIRLEENQSIYAFADIEEDLPVLIVSRGILDVAAVTAQLSLASTSRQRSIVADVVLAGALATATGQKFRETSWFAEFANPNAIPQSAWRSAYLSRVAFILAHEIGHHCRGHFRGSVTPGSTDFDPTLHVITSNSKKVVGIRPPPPEPQPDPVALAKNKRFREKELDADKFAIQVMESVIRDGTSDFAFLTLEHFLSEVAELAMIDGLSGRCMSPTQEVLFKHPVCVKRFHHIAKAIENVLVVSEQLLDYVRYIDGLLLCMYGKQDPISVYKRSIRNVILLCDDDSPLETLAKVMPSASSAFGSEGYVRLTVKVTDAAVRPILARSRTVAPSVVKWLREGNEPRPDEDTQGAQIFTTRLSKAQAQSKKWLTFAGQTPLEGGSFQVSADGKTVVEGEIQGQRVTQKNRNPALDAPFHLSSSVAAVRSQD